MCARYVEERYPASAELSIKMKREVRRTMRRPYLSQIGPQTIVNMPLERYVSSQVWYHHIHSKKVHLRGQRIARQSKSHQFFCCIEIPYHFINRWQVHRWCDCRKECRHSHKKQDHGALAFPFLEWICILLTAMIAGKKFRAQREVKTLPGNSKGGLFPCHFQ